MPIRKYDISCMEDAIEESRKAAKNKCMPFGAVLADEKGNVVLRAQNGSFAAAKRGGTGDVTRHAEMELYMVALRSASRKSFRVPGGFDIDIRSLYGPYAREGIRAIEVEGPMLENQALEAHARSGVWPKCEDFLKSKEKADQEDIQVEKSLLMSGLGSAPAVDNGTVPIIDISGPRAEVADKLWHAATNVGFFIVTGHGIPQAIIDDAFDTSKEFFAQPLDAKQAQSPFAAHLNSGYEFMSQVRPSTGLADQKESLQITAREGCMDGRWPNDGLQSKAISLMEAAHSLAGLILDLLEPFALPDAPGERGILSGSHTLWADDGQCTLRLLHYPPATEGEYCAFTRRRTLASRSAYRLV